MDFYKDFKCSNKELKKYRGKTVVVKYGGNAMVNQELKENVMKDIAFLSSKEINVVLVHGGGPTISRLLDKVGIKSEFIRGLRITDEETMTYVQMALAGKVNKDLVNLIHLAGAKAIGLCGIDGHMITAKQIDRELGCVGEITDIDVAPISDIIDKGYIPVISTIGCDEKGNVYNINADTAAAHIAAALKAETLISMTDIKGILRDHEDDSTLIPMLPVTEVPRLVEEGVISGGMIPKVKCCVTAMKSGVGQVAIIDGRQPHSVLHGVLTGKKQGTEFV